MFTAPKPPYLGVAYYPEDWPDQEMDKDIAKMAEIGIKVARIAEFAWHRMEPKPGEFDFTFFHTVVDKLAAAGIATVLGTPTATPPRWLSKMYPDVMAIHEFGIPMNHGGRRHCCSNNPHYNEYCMRIVDRMAKEFADDPAVIGWQVDNEIYTGDLGCFCPDCQAKFREMLRAKYGTIDALNEAWNLNLFSQWYDEFEDIPAPRNAWHNPHLLLEWRCFQNDSHVQFVGRQADILHKYVKNVPVGTDTMPVGGLDYRKMTDKLDIAQFNHYNTPENLWQVGLWFDNNRMWKDRPFWNTETATCWNGSTNITQSVKPEGFCRANSWMPIALGAEANMYWLWRTHWAGHELMHGAVLDTSGREMHTTGEVREVAKGYEKAADFVNGTKVDTDIAMHFTSRNWNMMASQSVVKDWKYLPTLQKHFYRPMIDEGLRPDVIDAHACLKKYKVLFTPLMMTIEEGGLCERIPEWVRDGGTWIVGPLSDVRNFDGARWRDRYYGMLEELTGIEWKFAAPDLEGNVKAAWADGTPFTGETWFEMIEPGKNESLASVTQCHSAMVGKSLLTECKVGKGKIVILGTLPSDADMRKILARYCEGCGKAEGEIMVAKRKGEAGEGVILVECAAKEAAYTLDRPMLDLLTGETLSGRVALKPYEVRVLKNA